MYSAHRPHRVCMVGWCTMGHCALVHFVTGVFVLAGLLQHCWEDSVVDHLPVVGYFFGCGEGYSYISLIDCWGQASWDGFVVQTLVLTGRVAQGWGLELVALVVRNRFVGVAVPRMWEFSPHTTMLAKP